MPPAVHWNVVAGRQAPEAAHWVMLARRLREVVGAAPYAKVQVETACASHVWALQVAGWMLVAICVTRRVVWIEPPPRNCTSGSGRVS